jgi:hypothetical protein
VITDKHIEEKSYVLFIARRRKVKKSKDICLNQPSGSQRNGRRRDD